MRQRVMVVLSVCAALLWPAPACAQDASYPAKPVMMITPAAAGNSPDVTGRIVADRLSQLWKQQVLILNRPGAGGLMAAQAASQAEKDGYTLYMTQASTYTVLPIMQQKLPFDLQRDFVPIILIAEQPIAVAVTPSLEVNTLPELIALIRKTPGGLLFGATNRGSQSHLTGELLRSKAGLELTFVHATGVASTINDVATGRLPIVFEGLAGLAGALQGKLVKPLAVASAQRLPNFPDLPTFAETVPGFQSQGWLALMAPAGVPEAVIAKVNADVRTVLALDEVKEKFAALGSYPRPLSPKETGEYIRREQDAWSPLVRQVVPQTK